MPTTFSTLTEFVADALEATLDSDVDTDGLVDLADRAEFAVIQLAVESDSVAARSALSILAASLADVPPVGPERLSSNAGRGLRAVHAILVGVRNAGVSKQVNDETLVDALSTAGTLLRLLGQGESDAFRRVVEENHALPGFVRAARCLEECAE